MYIYQGNDTCNCKLLKDRSTLCTHTCHPFGVIYSKLKHILEYCKSQSILPDIHIHAAMYALYDQFLCGQLVLVHTCYTLLRNIYYNLNHNLLLSSCTFGLQHLLLTHVTFPLFVHVSPTQGLHHCILCSCSHLYSLCSLSYKNCWHSNSEVNLHECLLQLSYSISIAYSGIEPISIQIQPVQYHLANYLSIRERAQTTCILHSHALIHFLYTVHLIE